MPNLTIGEERMKADCRQFGGLILMLGLVATIGALVNIVGKVGPSGVYGPTIERALFAAHVAQTVFGVLAVFTGYQQFILDQGSRYLTLILIAATQLAFMPYVTIMTDIVKKANDADEDVINFIPASLEPSKADEKFFGAMGVLAVFAHGFAYIGSLAFMEFALYAYQVGKFTDRTSSYYRGRSFAYNFMLLIGGGTQFALGLYSLVQFGKGPYDAPVGVAMYTIYYPGIAIFVGLFQICISLIGVARALGLRGGESDHSFQLLCFIMWLCMVSMSITTQVGYAARGMLAAAAPTRTCITFGIAFMPAFLDAKMRLTPDEFPKNFFSSSSGDKEDEGSVEELKEGPAQEA